MHRAELLFPAPRTIAEALHGALSPESQPAFDDAAASWAPRGKAASDVPKTTGRVFLVDDGVRVEIDADDLSSLRAAVNSWLRWIDAAQKAAAIGRR